MHFFQQILEDLNVKYTVRYAKQLFESRTDSGSLYGIKKMLETFSLSITAIRIMDVDTIQYPCICLHEGRYVVLHNPPQWKNALLGEVVLSVTDMGVAREPDYLKHRLQLILIYVMPYITALAALFLAVASFMLPLRFDWNMLIVAILNVMGVYFSWRTVAKECSGACHDVLESAGSKIFGLYSLGVIGLSYFIGSLIITLFIPSLAPIFALISCVAIAMPLWSISYQAFVVRSWCRNCIAVQGVVIATFITELLFHKIDISQLSIVPFLSTVSLYIIVFFVCDRVYSVVRKEKIYPKNLIFTYRALMSDKSVLQSIINRGDVRDTSGASTIVVNNPDAAGFEMGTDIHVRELFLVISPFCSYCRELFAKLKEMLDSGKLKEYRVVLLFADEPAGLPVYASVISEYQTHGAEAAMQLLSEWYESLKIRKFRKIYTKISTTSELESEIERQKEWFYRMNFSGTPIMLIDSHQISHMLLEGISG
ncbi:MAG: hypothetical protein PHD11_09490 [Bacteroidales bacterium]|nr:hypothetical protein [Bacteroidales bacterium]